jgi:hypothetical protein
MVRNSIYRGNCAHLSQSGAARNRLLKDSFRKLEIGRRAIPMYNVGILFPFFTVGVGLDLQYVAFKLYYLVLSQAHKQSRV